MPTVPFSENIVADGTIGPGGAPWCLYDNGTLVVGEVSINYLFPWVDIRTQITDIEFTAPIEAGNTLAFFFSEGRLPNLTAINGLYHFDTSNVMLMQGMFGGASGLTSLNLSGWDIVLFIQNGQILPVE